MPLLGPQEKGELEALVLERLREHYDRHGAQSLLVPGLCVVLSSRGVALAATAMNATAAQVNRYSPA